MLNMINKKKLNLICIFSRSFYYYLINRLNKNVDYDNNNINWKY